ncbi:hypothetical protein E4U43_005129 [Claviceps pusilla]|uniref:Uncharacterized protein n=1 Tax=Claviceps pusilla TaxID=123648 RepID=A0A9P7NH30_9HYPO|nr:hypothetical protein E4U43_005129 [Claviceps pusilla]
MEQSNRQPRLRARFVMGPFQSLIVLTLDEYQTGHSSSSIADKVAPQQQHFLARTGNWQTCRSLEAGCCPWAIGLIWTDWPIEYP